MPQPPTPVRRYHQSLLQTMQDIGHHQKWFTSPLNLGGVPGPGGGSGIPIGGLIGQLIQSKVAYDTTEAEILSPPPSGRSLVSNLDTIRWRIGWLETHFGSPLIIQEESVQKASGVVIMNFQGGVNVTSPQPNTVNVIVTATGGGSILGGVTVVFEDLTSQIPAADDFYVVSQPIMSGTSQVYMNGLHQVPSYYTETSSGVGLTETLVGTDELLIEYLTSGGTTIGLKVFDTGVFQASGVTALNFIGAESITVSGTRVNISFSGGAGGGGPHTLGSATHTDVTITSVGDDDILAYDSGGDWINQTAAEAGLATDSHTHSDVVDVSADDTTAGYLEDKIVQGSNIAITVLNPAGDEDLEIAATGLSISGHAHSEYAPSGHLHDDRYYTETEVDGLLHDPVTVLDTPSLNLELAGQAISGYVISSGVNHGQLIGLGDNDHPQYAPSGHGHADTDTKQVLVSSNDTTQGYLEDKVVQGNNVNITVLNEGANEQLQVSASGVGGGSGVSDHGFLTGLGDNDHPQYALSGHGHADTDTKQVLVSSNDTTQGYLEDKIVAGTNITITTLDEGANETVEITSTASGGGGSAIEVRDEGVPLTSGVTSLDFVGGGVTATTIGDAVTVTIPSGLGGDGGGEIDFGDWQDGDLEWWAGGSEATLDTNSYTKYYHVGRTVHVIAYLVSDTGSLTGTFTLRNLPVPVDPSLQVGVSQIGAVRHRDEGTAFRDLKAQVDGTTATTVNLKAINSFTAYSDTIDVDDSMTAHLTYYAASGVSLSGGGEGGGGSTIFPVFRTYDGTSDTYTRDDSVWEQMGSASGIITTTVANTPLLVEAAFHVEPYSTSWEHYAYRFVLDGTNYSNSYTRNYDASRPHDLYGQIVHLHNVFSGAISVGDHSVALQWQNGSDLNMRSDWRQLSVISLGATGGGAGGGSPINVDDEGINIASGVTNLNFVGGGVTATASGTTVTVTVPSGVGGGTSNLVYEYVGDGTDTFIDFTVTQAIRDSYDTLVFHIEGDTDRAGNALEGLRLQFAPSGGAIDTGNNYWRQVREIGDSDVNEENTSGGAIWIGRYSMTGATADSPAGYLYFSMAGWDNNNSYVNVTGQATGFGSTSSYRVSDFWGTWRNATTPGTIRLYSHSTSNFTSDTRIRVYGLPNAGGGGGGGSAITVKDEGVDLTTGVTSLDFVGGGVTAVTAGDDVTVTIPSGGSAIVAKDEGVILTSGITSLDFVGGGITATTIGNDVTVTVSGVGEDGSYWESLVKPVTSSAYDDEFDDVSFDTGLWTEFDPATRITISETEQGAKIVHSSAGAGAGGFYQDIPAGDFTIVARVSLSHVRETEAAVAIGLWEDAAGNPTTSDMYLLQMRWTATVRGVLVTHMNDYNSWNSNAVVIDDLVATETFIYLRVRRTGTTYKFDRSLDGVGWEQLRSGTIPFTASEFGIVSANSGANDSYSAISFFRYKDSDVGVDGILEGRSIAFWDKGSVAGGANDSKVTIFTAEGEITTASGALRMYNKWGRSISITNVFTAVSTAPSGSALIVDINKDGTSIFTDQAKRPLIVSGAYTDTSDTPDIQAWANDSYLTMDVDQVGSTVAGSNLVVHVVGD